jgi:hypothetical protein
MIQIAMIGLYIHHIHHRSPKADAAMDSFATLTAPQRFSARHGVLQTKHKPRGQAHTLLRQDSRVYSPASGISISRLWSRVQSRWPREQSMPVTGPI